MFKYFISFLFSIIILTSAYNANGAWITLNSGMDYQLEKKSGTDFGYMAGVSLGVQPLPVFAVTADADVLVSNNSWGMQKFSINLISQTELNPKNLDYTPYIGVGIGFIHATDSVSSDTINYEQSNMSGIGINVPVMAGIRMNILSLMINLDIRYTYAKATLSHKYSNYSFERDYSGFSASVSLGYLF